jgi:hypothetical protein
MGRRWILALVICAACGSSAPPPEEPSPAATWECASLNPAECESRRTVEVLNPDRNDGSDGMRLEGALGSIPTRDVNAALQVRYEAFQKCFGRRYDAIDFLDGTLGFSFRVGLDGRVVNVFPRTSDVGDRPTEQCLLDVAKKTRFPQPQGGEAEFVWQLSVDVAEGIRPALNWDANTMTSGIEEARASVASCGFGKAQAQAIVTVYIAVGGTVLSAGASTDQAKHVDKLDCVINSVKAVTFQDPGSYPAKVSFSVP